MAVHLRKEKRKEFQKFIYRRWDVDEFERQWEAFMGKFNVTDKGNKKGKGRGAKKVKKNGKQVSWLNRMYELRKKWAAAYTKSRYFLGMMSNQRSESLNSRLHVHLNRKMKLVDMLQHVEHCVSIMRKNERALDFVASHTIPFTKITAHPMEIAASYIYTPVMFGKVKRQVVEGTNWQVTDRAECAGLVIYDVLRKVPYHKVPYAKDAKDLQGKDDEHCDAKVAKELERNNAKGLDAKILDGEDPQDLKGVEAEELEAKKLDKEGLDAKSVGSQYRVTCVFNNNKLSAASCQCARMESQDYPCAHIFCVLDHMGVREYPNIFVKKRWTKHAKPAYSSKRTANTHVWSEHMEKYHKLCNMANDALFTAAASNTTSEEVMEFLRSILDGEETEFDEGHKTFVPLPAFFSDARQCFTEDVEDPIKIVPKGRPTTEESNKRMKSMREKMRCKKKKMKLVLMFISMFISIRHIVISYV